MQPTIRLATKEYDYLLPLMSGDIHLDSVKLALTSDTLHALQWPHNLSIHAGELSLSRFLMRLANGDRSLVGIPFFTVRGFRHRCFYVHRTSEIRELRDLRGKRIGTNEWPATGNTWSRKLIREQGIELDEIDWRVGPVSNSVSTRMEDKLPPMLVLATPERRCKECSLTGSWTR
jgi:4,5-dihydroxyphthalate decarboxylase